MTWSDFAAVAVRTAVVTAGVAYLAYDSAWGILAYIPLFFLFWKLHREKQTKERLWQLNLGFCEVLQAMSAALESGYSVENGVTEAYLDLKAVHRESEPVMKELKMISTKIRLGVSVEDAFLSLADRSGLSDVRSFADVFSTAKRTGGNVIDVIRSTSETIHARTELARDLRSAVASKKYEADVMKILPAFMIAYLRVTSPALVEGLYGSIKGALFMTMIMAVYAGLCYLAGRIVRIEF